MEWLPQIIVVVAVATAAVAWLILRPKSLLGAGKRRSAGTSWGVEGLTWVGSGQVIRVGNLDLVSPLVYFCDSRSSGKSDEPAAVDLSLKVASRQKRSTSRQLPLAPRYDRLTPGERRTYLQWLAEDRQQMPSDHGYLRLFLFNLERRSLADQADQSLIFDELLRLRRGQALAGEPVSRGLDACLTSLLWYLAARRPVTISLDRVRELVESTLVWSEECVAAALMWFCVRDVPLPDFAAWAIAGELPQSQPSVVVKRVADEFRALFMKRYSRQFGAGLRLASGSDRVYAYRPANPSLPQMEFTGPNPAGLASQLVPVSDLWNQCVAELKKFSMIVGRGGQQPLTAAAWRALPADLRATIDHPLADAVAALAPPADQPGHALVTASDLASTLEMPRADRYPIGQSRFLCQALQEMGYGLEPDARLTGKGYRGDDRLALFWLSSQDQPDPVRYSAASCMLRIGLSVASADGEIQQDRLAMLAQQIQTAFNLEQHELRRIEVLRSLLLITGQTALAGIGSLAKSLTGPQREAVARLILAIVGADGVVTPRELRAVRICYDRLGLDAEQLDGAMKSLRVGSAPASGVARSSLALDRQAIAAIMGDTRDVAQMLATAMAVESRSETTLDASSPAGMAAMPERFAAFYATLMTRSEWPLEEAESLARQHGHMLGGAVEELNQWAYDTYGNPVFIERGDRLYVDRQIIT